MLFVPEIRVERRDRKNSIVYLAGFMGSGKSTIGPILANTIGYGFEDVDRVIERSQGAPVNVVFLQQGEERFRVIEHSVLLDLSRRTRLVIALGGGTIVEKENRDIIESSGIVVYLKSSSEGIYKRVRNRSDRPLLLKPDGTRLNDDELRTRIIELHREREPYYSFADVTISVDNKDVGLTVDEIVKLISHILT